MRAKHKLLHHFAQKGRFGLLRQTDKLVPHCRLLFQTPHSHRDVRRPPQVVNWYCWCYAYLWLGAQIAHRAQKAHSSHTERMVLGEHSSVLLMFLTP